MKTYILIADLDTNERSDIQNLEGQTFSSPSDVLKKINNRNDIVNKCISLSDFTELVNNEEFYDGNCWIAFVYVAFEQ